jgi:hypothetical protein
MICIAINSSGSKPILADGANPDYGRMNVIIRACPDRWSLRMKRLILTGSETSILDVVEVVANGVPCSTTPVESELWWWQRSNNEDVPGCETGVTLVSGYAWRQSITIDNESD